MLLLNGSMRRKIRCQFEVHSSEITGIPQEYDQVKLVIGHQQSNKRYAASYAIPTSGSDQRERSTKGIEGATAWEPLLAFTCHVYPSKVSWPTCKVLHHHLLLLQGLLAWRMLAYFKLRRLPA